MVGHRPDNPTAHLDKDAVVGGKVVCLRNIRVDWIGLGIFAALSRVSFDVLHHRVFPAQFAVVRKVVHDLVVAEPHARVGGPHLSNCPHVKPTEVPFICIVIGR